MQGSRPFFLLIINIIMNTMVLNTWYKVPGTYVPGIDYSTSRCFFILYFSCGDYAAFSVYVATCTAYRMYLISTCMDLTFNFSWRCERALVIMRVLCFYHFLYLFVFFPEVSFYSRVILEFVLRPRTSLYCDDEVI